MSRLIRKQPLEGWFLTTKEGLIFDTKGINHPPDRVIAYLRYIPAEFFDDRVSNEQRFGYTKVYLLKDRMKALQARFPWYLYSSKCMDATLQAVPYDQILHYHDPIKKFQKLVQHRNSKLDVLSKCCVEFGLAICSKSGIPLTSLGVTGSILVDLHTINSDIDLVIYGNDEGRIVYTLMTQLHEKTTNISGLRFYNKTDLKNLYKFRSRSTPITFDDFVKVEHKKVLQGKFNGYDFYIRLVYKVEEIEEQFSDRCFKNCGDIEFTALITEDKDRIFTPCRYAIQDVVPISTPVQPVTIEEIVSFRGRFCELAHVGDYVRARGKLEQVSDNKTGKLWYRVLLGQDHTDFMVIE